MLHLPCKNRNELNGLPYEPELASGAAMLNPHYPGVVLSPDCSLAFMDSGAFQKADMMNRLDPLTALERQTKFAALLSAGRRRPLTIVLCTYDCLRGVDEIIRAGERLKVRGTEETAALAVQLTLQAHEVYHRMRSRIGGCRLMFAAQGATPRQYIDDCVRPMLDIMRPGDSFAFGGWCILGKNKSLFPDFKACVSRTMPLLVRKGIGHAHLLGVIGWLPALEFAATEAARHGLLLTNDGSTLETEGVNGKRWRHEYVGPRGGHFEHAYTKEQKKAPGGYHPRDLAHANQAAYSRWAQTLPDETTLQRLQDYLRPGQLKLPLMRSAA